MHHNFAPATSRIGAAVMSSPQAARTASATAGNRTDDQAPVKALPVQAFDEYGFPLDLTPQQAKARQECIAAQRKQEEKWLKYTKAGQLPPMEKLKKLCRKVRQHYSKRLWSGGQLAG